MSGQIVLPDPTGVNHYDKDDRRQYMTKVFRQLGLWDDLENRLKAKKIRPRCEDLVSVRMDKNEYHSVSDTFFEYCTDLNVWSNLVNRGGRATWPWEDEPLPPRNKPWLPISETYKRWRLSHGKSIEEVPGRGATVQQSARTPVGKSQSPAGQTATKSLNGPAVPAKMQTNKSAPAVNVAAGAPVPRQVAKAPTKPSAAVTAQVDKDQQAFGSLAFEAERDKVAAEEAAKKKAATEKRLLRHRAARCTTAQSIFNTEVGKIMAKEFNAVDFRGQSWADEVELSEEDVTLPVRDVFGARREEAVKECTIPPYDVRLEIWEKFVHLEFSDCFPGPFEIAIPPWFDFHDLVLDGLDKIKENGLIDQDLVLLWSTQSGRPVRLVVGPDPSLFFDDETRDKEKVNRTRGVRVRTLWHQIAEWLCTVYRGNPICLADFLQARNDLVLQCGSHMLECSDYVFKLQEKWDHIKLDPLQSLHGAEYERENWDMWMPEIYAYISRPNGPNPAMLEEWVLRAGGLFEERLTIATAIWSTFDAMRAIDWWNQVMSTYSTEIVPSS